MVGLYKYIKPKRLKVTYSASKIGFWGALSHRAIQGLYTRRLLRLLWTPRSNYGLGFRAGFGSILDRVSVQVLLLLSRSSDSSVY